MLVAGEEAYPLSAIGLDVTMVVVVVVVDIAGGVAHSCLVCAAVSHIPRVDRRREAAAAVRGRSGDGTWLYR